MPRANYHTLRNPFTPATVFTEDRVAAVHETALRVGEELGLKVLLPEVHRIFAAALTLSHADQVENFKIILDS